MPKAPDEAFSTTKMPNFTHVYTSSKSRVCLEIRGNALLHRYPGSRKDGESLGVPVRHR
jgi:hypothetical protein